MLCIGERLGAGLRYDSGTGRISTRLSTSQPNLLQYGSDRGLYAPDAGSDPNPAMGRHTIAGLPERIAAANGGGGGGLLPFMSPQSIDYALTTRMDMISMHVHALADGHAVCRWNGMNSDLADRTDNAATVPLRDVTTVQLPFLNVDAGTRVTPTGRASGAPSSILTPDGGWFGFYAYQFPPMSLTEALTTIAARSVPFLVPESGEDFDQVELNVFAAADSVLDTQALDWTLLLVPSTWGPTNAQLATPWDDWVALFSSLGITVGVDLFGYGQAVPGEAPTTAELVAAGVEWVRLQTPDRAVNQTVGGITPEPVIDELVAAGINVLALTSGRQYWSDYWFGRGVRGVVSESPVYTRGARGYPGDLDYRVPTIPGLETRTPFEGSLTRLTDNGFAVSEHGFARQNAPGRNFPARYAWVGGIGGIGPRVNSQLLGPLCPLPRTSDYRLRLRARVDPAQTTVPAGATPKVAMFVCVPDDRSPSFFTPDAVNPPPPEAAHVNGYWIFVRIGSNRQGEFTIGILNDGFYEALVVAQAFTSITYGQWINFDVRVTDDQVTVVVSHQGVTRTYVLEDDTHRGPYAYYAWEDKFLTTTTNTGFIHGYSSFGPTTPMYTEL